MSGLNKNDKNKRRDFDRLLTIGGGIYLFLVVFFFLLLIFFPNLYNMYATHQVDTIKSNIEKVVKKGEYATQLDKIATSNPIQLVVKKDDTILFSNVEGNDYLVISKNLREDVVLYESYYPIVVDGSEFQVWLLVYNQMTKSVLIALFTIFIVFVILFCSVVALLVRVMFSRLVLPLQRLRENITKLKEYRLNDVNTDINEYDILSEDLSEFTKDLKRKMEDVEITYTSLEKELRANEEANINRIQLVSSLTHDLKTPLNIIQLSAYKMKKFKQYDEETLKVIEDKNEDVLNSVNEILAVMYNDRLEAHKGEKIEISKAIEDMLKVLKLLFEERKMTFALDMQPNLFVEMNSIEFKSVIHNALVNIYHYASQNTKCQIIVQTDGNKVALIFKNMVDDISNINFEHVFNLFHSSQKKGSHGSGVGMYVIKNIVQKNNGNCSFYQEEGKAVLKIELLLKAGDSQ